ncbi:RNA polymerase sigma factor [Saccharothrix luteola]|uniref:RNA polymerase sigma factor n=1 Tax=Saccharothrix luteola TaxID=2893018 RepID=UPI001E375F11|nr:sigma-70 family RNA polymerase sigma factor [Saccharothrix luteola]MCC8244190.1 sigma-70 family RNA polymerase sigma factor [Saccharothrix luteola]MCC8250912.1 sigma-70 family RNA polymerase sigma factor [Saccharothrix luteola]
MTPASPIAALVSAAAEGDQRAWNEIVARFTPLVLAVVHRHRLRHADVADVHQTVWLRLVEQLRSLREADALPGWIATTTRNECLRVLRVQQRTLPYDPRSEDEPASPDDAVADLDEELEAAQRRQALREGFRSLPEPCRVLLARLMADPPPSYAAVAEQLAMPVGSIGPTRIRCLEKLRKTPAVMELVEPRPVGGGGVVGVEGRSGVGQR